MIDYSGHLTKDEIERIVSAALVYGSAEQRRVNGWGGVKYVDLADMVIFTGARLDDTMAEILLNKPRELLDEIYQGAVEAVKFYNDRAKRWDTVGPTDKEKGFGTNPEAKTGRKLGSHNKKEPNDERPDEQASTPGNAATDTAGRDKEEGVLRGVKKW